MSVTIVGRSSSHFTRVARVFAHELGIGYTLRPVFDLRSLDAADYAGNPALKIPILVTDDGAWFGTSNICRELSRRAAAKPRIVWPEDLSIRLLANAQELVLHGMATEVALLMGASGASEVANTYQTKSRETLMNCLAWLERHVSEALGALPVARDVSFFEVTLFCFVTHLPFRGVAETSPYPKLVAFAERFAQRPSAQATEYRYDQA